ncbi:hypothetical protein QVD17_25452 [Tagetes erecta]|uniref:DUF7950 domain-containing protein n=1 Tax=Tagetes erecta TaxID=13708 RepID=A0AAD8NVE6_TARER|nr:hypothetical protein QVD17_25452 [Tagetes erecta]
MNGSGGYCISRYGGGGGGGGGYGQMHGLSKVDNIMLKFRPIAPKPVPASSVSGDSKTGNNDVYVNCGRSKRKYVRVNKTKIQKNNNCKRRKKPVVTLSLLPETPIPDPVAKLPDLDPLKLSLSPVCITNASPPMWFGFEKPEPLTTHVFVTHVMVECVTDTCVDVQMLGCTDEERLMNMEKDTCPGFISDGQDRVVWMNKAYRQMAGGDDTVVVLVRKDKTASLVTYPAFTCKVRVTYGTNSDRKQTMTPCSPTLTLPCDVWRMERGACAWRLDVKAALCLGR